MPEASVDEHRDPPPREGHVGAPPSQAGDVQWEVHPEPQTPSMQFATQGQLYRSIGIGLERLAAKLGQDGLFIGPPWAQARPETYYFK